MCALELFQDLSQLQEIWIAEGEGSLLCSLVYSWDIMSVFIYLFPIPLVICLQPTSQMMNSLFQISSQTAVSTQDSPFILVGHIFWMNSRNGKGKRPYT